MAQTKKTTAGKTAKSSTKGKGSKTAKKAVEVVPDFYKELETSDGVKVELNLYEKEDKADSVKLVIGGAFIIYCRAVLTDNYAFLSYPSFKSGDKFINQAFCFDKELIEEINDALNEWYFD